MVECEAKSARSVPENAPPHTHTASLCLFIRPRKKGKKKAPRALCYLQQHVNGRQRLLNNTFREAAGGGRKEGEEKRKRETEGGEG